MTRFDAVIDSPWWLMRQIGKRIKASTKVLFKFQVPFTRKRIMVYGVIDGITSFRLTLNSHEFGIGAFNFTLWIIRNKNA